MNDHVFIPRHVAHLLLEDVAQWEDVESLVSLLTVASIREPVETSNGYSRYIVKLDEIRSRFRVKSKLDQFSFLFKETPIPYIHKLNISKAPNRLIDYQVHDLCNPLFYSKRYRKNSVFDVFPVSMWRLPRHVLIRWRYSARLPIHKVNFIKPLSINDWRTSRLDEIETLPQAIEAFKRIEKNFHYIMVGCDESSVSYSFACYIYFYTHDTLIHLFKRDIVHTRFFDFLSKLDHCLESVSFLDMSPNRKIQRLEGMIRGIVPNGFFNKRPYSLFSERNFTKCI